MMHESKYYAVLLADKVLSVFEAHSLSRAVELKQQIQDHYNKMHRCDEVLALRSATAEEFARMDETAAGYMAAQPGWGKP